MSKTILIDSGHGGIIDGVYQTYPEKMHSFNKNEVLYEGVYNRIIKNKLIDRLLKLEIRYIDVCPTELDIDLDTRCDVVNEYCNALGKNNCLLISLHSNAGGGTGVEIWTTIGQTKSDLFAQMLAVQIKKDFPNLRFRKDEADGDLDKESNFYILANTKCPAIMPEFCFFDNYEDYKMMIKPGFQDKYIDSLTEFIKRVNLN